MLNIRKINERDIQEPFQPTGSLRFFQGCSFSVERMAIAAITENEMRLAEGENDDEATGEDRQSICSCGWTCL